MADGTDGDLQLTRGPLPLLASTAGPVFTAPALDRLYAAIAAAHGDPAGTPRCSE